jgi:predicted acetyltransferase
MSAVALVEPSRAWLAEFAAALARGWSPHTERDVSAEQLAELRADPEAFLAELVRPRRRLRLPDGTLVQRLPGFVRWIVDGAFCGTINFRYAPGTEALPSYCSGHIGYAVVPWQRRRGVATAALRLMLREAGAVSSLRRVQITCDDDNLASRRVILACGGVRTADQPPLRPGGRIKHAFWVPVPGGAAVSSTAPER